MRCHIHTEPDGFKVLIPGCWGVATHWHLPDEEALEWCTCPPIYKGKTKSEIIEEQNNIIRNLKIDIELLKQKVQSLTNEIHERNKI